MNNAVKITLYVVLAIAAIWLGLRFYSEFKRNTAEKEISPETNEIVNATNSLMAATNQVETNVVAQATNVTAEGTNPLASATQTNQTTTNVTAEATNQAQQATSAVTAVNSPNNTVLSAKKIGKGKMMAYLGALIGVVIILGLLVAYDVTQFLGSRTVDLLFNDDLKGVYNPEYEEAEHAWANGKPLDAIQLMREYLKKNPREQYVALRIAEIYEKDLGNYLAAALEYEQVLQHKLPRERWGWAAIHLCNLYSKMGKEEPCVAMLRRIESEYSETAAAKKARNRLAMFESMGDSTALGTDSPEDAAAPEVAPKSTPKVRVVGKVEPRQPESNLPPGFRPKR